MIKPPVHYSSSAVCFTEVHIKPGDLNLRSQQIFCSNPLGLKTTGCNLMFCPLESNHQANNNQWQWIFSSGIWIFQNPPRSKSRTEMSPVCFWPFVVSHGYSWSREWLGEVRNVLTKNNWQKMGASTLIWNPRQEAEWRDVQIQMLSSLSWSVVSTSTVLCHSTSSTDTAWINRCLFPVHWVAKIQIALIQRIRFLNVDQASVQ